MEHTSCYRIIHGSGSNLGTDVDPEWCFSENNEGLELLLSEDAASDLENSPKFVESGPLDSFPKRQFKTAEIADAVMGTEAPIDPSDIESLFPKTVKDSLSGFSLPCDDGSAQCGPPTVPASGESQEEKTSESSQQVLSSTTTWKGVVVNHLKC